MFLYLHFHRTRQRTLEMEAKLFDLGSRSSIFIHDLKNIMNPLINQTSLLVKKSQNKDNIKILESNINTQIGVLSEYIMEFNQGFSFKSEKSEILISSLIESCKKMYTKQCSGIEFKIEQESPLISDINLVKSIISNMLINSADAFDSQKITNKQVRISFSDNKLIFADNAGGIPEDKLIDIKMSSYFSTKEKGSGVGIYTIKKYVSLMKGNLDFENSNGGLKITITFNK